MAHATIRAAAAEAKMQLGAANVDTQMQDIEREAMDIQLQDKLLEYKQQMGMLGTGAETKQIESNSSVVDITPAKESSQSNG